MEEQKRKYEFYSDIRDQVVRAYNKLREEKRTSVLMDVAMLYLISLTYLEDIVDADKFKTDDEVINFIDNELFSRFELKEENEMYKLLDKTENKVVYNIRKDCLGHTLKLREILTVGEKDHVLDYLSWRIPKHLYILDYLESVYIEIQPVCTEKYDDDNQDRVVFTFQVGTHVMDWSNYRIEEAYVYWHDDESNVTIKIRQSINTDVNNDLRVIVAFKDYILPIVRKILKENYEN